MTAPEGAVLPVASVVIPAHDEEASIGRLLSSLSSAGGELEVVVACNGCTDATADVARSYDVRVVEIPQASKPAALNAGDRVASRFPRCYVDGDVVVAPDTIRDLVGALAHGGLLCATAPMHVDVTGRPWPVRAYYRLWSRTDYAQRHHVGGVFAFSEVGRARFDAFPEVVNDDLFVRSCFRATEVATVATQPFTVQAPRTLRGLVRRRVRVEIGNLQQRGGTAAVESASVTPVLPDYAPWWHAVRSDPRLLPSAVPYLVVHGIAKVVARWRARRGAAVTWARDDSRRPG